VTPYVTPYLNSLTIAYPLYNFYGATITNKGSLQVSIAIVKSFKPIFGPQFGWVT